MKFLVLFFLSLPAWANECADRASGMPDFSGATFDAVRGPLTEAFRSGRYSKLWPDWSLARAKLAEVEATAAAAIPSEKKYFNTIVELARAALSKHHLVYMKEDKMHHVALPNHLAILRAIAAFDGAAPRFSLYKIKRAVELRYSVREYARCR